MPKIIDHHQRRAEIVAVARRLILEGGFDAATMRSIASAAGFANGALKHYFPGKDSIIEATFDAALGEMQQKGALADRSALAAMPPAQALRAWLMAPFPDEADKIENGRVLLVLWERAAASPTLAARYRTFFDDWRNNTRDYLRPVLRIEDPALDLWALEAMSLTISANVVNLMHPDGRFIDAYHALVERFVARCIAASPP